MGFHLHIWGAVKGGTEKMATVISGKVQEINAAFNRMSASYEAQRQIELEHAKTLRQLRFEVNDLRDEICLATQNTHVETAQCREALLSATKNLTKAIDELEDLDAL